jgi:hypothetical protein
MDVLLALPMWFFVDVFEQFGCACIMWPKNRVHKIARIDG